MRAIAMVVALVATMVEARTFTPVMPSADECGKNFIRTLLSHRRQPAAVPIPDECLTMSFPRGTEVRELAGGLHELRYRGRYLATLLLPQEQARPTPSPAVVERAATRSPHVSGFREHTAAGAVFVEANRPEDHP